ncbi:hypothetical protein [Jatrophihabitans lederbergiae]|uniref:Uncharacterized protein n=1 Tax=Jatrophihabitans lederbergiae TaxID=3075547 RepID=A0ABU2JD00_9ACTN|nr:hypothetical protein [Jatrophihabitans sp. DSM 44399]MDT0262859.1 hypothetical protein [Jatrophihabitans sp. DSM 44399]
MQAWIVGGAWLFAVLVAVVVLGFALYELVWKTRRLTTERASLEQLVAELTAVGEQLRTSADRLR